MLRTWEDSFSTWILSLQALWTHASLKWKNMKANTISRRSTRVCLNALSWLILEMARCWKSLSNQKLHADLYNALASSNTWTLNTALAMKFPGNIPNKDTFKHWITTWSTNKLHYPWIRGSPLFNLLSSANSGSILKRSSTLLVDASRSMVALATHATRWSSTRVSKSATSRQLWDTASIWTSPFFQQTSVKWSAKDTPTSTLDIALAIKLNLLHKVEET
jgi:hypothetical protein